ncbi:Peroxisomal membrane signal receptor PTS1 [Entophlyctis luteolus]|nr:Peroxisomal membrane signal receptor PTS1 [Entophlyctis luteolus]
MADASCSSSNALKALVATASVSSSSAPWKINSPAQPDTHSLPVGRAIPNPTTAPHTAFFAPKPPSAQQVAAVSNAPFDIPPVHSNLPAMSILQHPQPTLAMSSITPVTTLAEEFAHFGVFDNAFARAKESFPRADQVQQPSPFGNVALRLPMHRQIAPSFQQLPTHPVLQDSQTRATIVEQHAVAFDRAFSDAQEAFARENTGLQNPFARMLDLHGSADSLLSQTAGHLVQTVENNFEAQANPKFAQSKFIDFMRQIRDGELGIQNNKVVEKGTKSRSDASLRQNRLSEHHETEQLPVPSLNSQPMSASNGWVKEVGAGMNGSSGRYLENAYDDGAGYAGFGLTAEQMKPYSWGTDFQNTSNMLMHEEQESQLEQQNSSDDQKPWDELMADPFKEFFDATGTGPARAKDSTQNLEQNRAQEWLDLEQSWKTNIDQNAYSNFKLSQDTPHTYDFVPKNPYLARRVSYLKDISQHQSIAESVLALEAAVQIDPQDATAWKNLGLRQQENENELAAIAAFERATILDPQLLDSWIGLAVSYTNESMYSEAFKALESWVSNNPKYKQTLFATKEGFNQHDRLTSIFLNAVQMNPHTLDPHLQMGLGVLFNISGQYSKALDCFSACLKVHPDDYMLWNKLGATLANSRSPKKALEAYGRALELNPNFLRARYNVAVALIQLGKYHDAAVQLIEVLREQEANVRAVVDGEKGKVVGSYEERLWEMHALSSQSAWSTLWILMDRYSGPDLAKAAFSKDLSAFDNGNLSTTENAF